MQYNVCSVLYSQFSHQCVSAAIAGIFSVITIFLSHEYKVQMWLAVSPSFLKNEKLFAPLYVFL
jgi:hypothetical protein